MNSVAPWKLWTWRLLRWALAILFLWAAIPKIWKASEFAEAVSYYHLLPMIGVNWVAMLLPWVEAVCALALLLGVCTRGAALLIAAMLVVFIGALAYSIQRGLDINCGCFGLSDGGRTVGYFEIARNLVLLAVAGIIFWLDKSCSRAQTRRGQPVEQPHGPKTP